MHSAIRTFMAGGALSAAGLSVCAIGQTVAVTPVNAPLNLGTANVCTSGQTTPAPCSQTASLTFKFTSGGSMAAPSVLTMGAPSLDFTDVGTGTCTTNGTTHAYNAGDTCTVDVKFAPIFPGQRHGAVVLTDQASPANLLATAYLSGTSNGPHVAFTSNSAQRIWWSIASDYGTFDPDSLAVDGFGNVFVGSLGRGGRIDELLAKDGYQTVTIIDDSDFTPVPYGIAVDGAGNVFRVDGQFTGVTEIVAAGGYTTTKLLGSGLNRAWGVTLDSSGNIFVADRGNKAVKEFVAAGGYTTIQTLGSGFVDPMRLAVDANGNVFVADKGAVKEIVAAGGYTTVKTLGSGISAPSDLALDANGNLIVADNPAAGSEVKIILAADGYSTVIPFVNLDSIASETESLTLDTNGNLLVGILEHDGVTCEVLRFDFNTPPSLSFATTEGGATSSDSPQTVTIGSDGNQDLNFLDINYPPDFPEASGVSSDCTKSSSLPAGTSCTLSVAFSPVIASLSAISTSLSETVIITDNSLNSTAAAQPVAVSGTATVISSLTSPAPGSALSGSSATFTWDSVAASTFRFQLGSAPGGNDLYDSGVTSQKSVVVTGLPTLGIAMNATLSYKWNGQWYAVGYQFIEALPVLLTPPAGSTLAGSSAKFTWDPGASTRFIFRLGSVSGGDNVYESGVIGRTSTTANKLPTNGETLYATLYFEWKGKWYAHRYTFLAATSLPRLLTPTPGSTFAGASATFSWDPASKRTFQLRLGTSPGGYDIYILGTTNKTSVTVTSLPRNGATVYARFSYNEGGVWHPTDYVYTEASTPPAMLTPTPGTRLTGASETFTWSRGSETRFRFRLGTTLGGDDILDTSLNGLGSVYVTDLPTNGATIYARLSYDERGVWHAIDYVYKAQ